MTEQIPSLEVIDELEYGVWKATVLQAALELDLFTTIAEGHHTLNFSVSPLIIIAGINELYDMPFRTACWPSTWKGG